MLTNDLYESDYKKKNKRLLEQLLLIHYGFWLYIALQRNNRCHYSTTTTNQDNGPL